MVSFSELSPAIWCLAKETFPKVSGGYSVWGQGVGRMQQTPEKAEHPVEEPSVGDRVGQRPLAQTPTSENEMLLPNGL